jgi:hypothetical protein
MDRTAATSPGPVVTPLRCTVYAREGQKRKGPTEKGWALKVVVQSTPDFELSLQTPG